jgi:MinD superfamily P-loop ATPase
VVELVVLSGKGGTGKTSLTAAFAHLAGQTVICDLDVDAPDMHLLLQPKRIKSEAFRSGHKARILPEVCNGCGICIDVCRYQAITRTDGLAKIDALRCEGCKSCVVLCPSEAIAFDEKHCGDWYLSDTRMGPLVHAQLFPGEENSGRLVALLRQKARALAEKNRYGLILSDGPPGIGCPVISSLSGASLAVLVTEPTPSGRHDLLRIVELCQHFKVPSGVIINKCDLNQDQRRQIELFCDDQGLPILGGLPYDPVFIEAVVKGQTITEYQPNGIAKGVAAIWSKIQTLAGLPLSASASRLI